MPSHRSKPDIWAEAFAADIENFPAESSSVARGQITTGDWLRLPQRTSAAENSDQSENLPVPVPYPNISSEKYEPANASFMEPPIVISDDIADSFFG